MKNYQDVKELLQAWGHYRTEGTSYYYSHEKVVHHVSPPVKAYYLQTCLVCLGDGVVDGVVCQKCNGSKKVQVVYDKCDPRMIKSTGKGGMYVVYHSQPPVEFQQIDDVLKTWYLAMSCTVCAHYVYYPNYGKDNQKRMAWVNERLKANDLPVLDGEVMYLGLLMGAKNRLSRLFDLPVKVNQKKVAGAKGGRKTAKRMTLQEKVDRATNASVIRWRKTLHLT